VPAPCRAISVSVRLNQAVWGFYDLFVHACQRGIKLIIHNSHLSTPSPYLNLSHFTVSYAVSIRIRGQHLFFATNIESCYFRPCRSSPSLFHHHQTPQAATLCADSDLSVLLGLARQGGSSRRLTLAPRFCVSRGTLFTLAGADQLRALVAGLGSPVFEAGQSCDRCGQGGVLLVSVGTWGTAGGPACASAISNVRARSPATNGVCNQISMGPTRLR
jgi:hypothetical protein